ncbi:MAG: DEAD/DEAH box helicase [Prevotella sp.]|nr:DEAD/DEAH box helicase [Prevotella sp.]
MTKSIYYILDKLGIKQLNEMQEEAVDAILHNNGDVVLLSPTGSGKTLAYLLPLTQMVNPDFDEVQAVVVVPGRELALQSANVLKDMGCGLRACACYGGRATMDEHRVLRQVRPHIVFATPGRLNDHLDKGNISPSLVKYLVIDEFDKCLEMGFLEEMRRAVEALPNVRRRVLLSATDAESIPRFVNMGRTQRLDYLIKEEQVSERVRIFEVKSPVKDKLDTLKELLLDIGNQGSIVFLNYRDSVERVASFLQGEGFTISSFHGGMEQRQREDALYKFSNGSANILVATDLASRGLDIPMIDNIIHYHLPESEHGYVHRVGRTARWDAQGRAFFILNPEERIPDYVEGDIETYTPQPTTHDIPVPRMATLYIGKGKKDKLSKGDIVGFLCKKGGLTAAEIGRISIEERFTYVAIDRQQLASVLSKVQGEKVKGIKTIIEEIG